MKKCILFLILSYTWVGLSQQSEIRMPLFAPPTPETASLLKFHETPVSFYTGQASTNIPMYTINVDGVSLPIGLNYHSGGIRVNEVATSVGLGWGLSQGGQITRVIKGKPDEKNYLTTDKTVPYIKNLLKDPSSYKYSTPFSGPIAHVISELSSLPTNQTEGSLDVQPDEFIYNFNGYSGKFVFNQKRSVSNPYGELVMLPENNLKITPIFDENIIIRWEIQDPNGIKYIFGVDTWDSRLSNSAGEFLNTTQNVSAKSDKYTSVNAFTGWKIKRIITPNKRTIDFEYTTDNFHEASFNGETQIVSPYSYRHQSKYNSKSFSSSIGRKSRLIKIRTSKEELTFNYGSREDSPSGFKLERVEVRDYHGNLINKINLNHSYFISADTKQNDFWYSNSYPYRMTDQEFKKRLKLDSVDFFDTDTGDKIATYTLAYNETRPLPRRFSYAQDAWGYYNGKNSNNSVLPKVNFYDINGSLLTVGGSNRAIDSTYTQSGMLTSITYPEGGRTEYIYENNRFQLETSQLYGLEHVLGVPLENQSVSLINDRTHWDRRRLNPNTNLYEYSYITDFNISEDVKDQGKVEFTTYSKITGEQESPIYKVYFEIIKNTGNVHESIVYSSELISSGSLNLSPGDYRLRMIIETSYYDERKDEARISLKWKKEIPRLQTVKTGGLRIKEMKHFDVGSTTPKMMKKYKYPIYLISDFLKMPVFLQKIKMTEVVPIEKGDFPYILDISAGLKLHSYPVHPVLSIGNGNFGYKKVIEQIVSPVNESVLYENEYQYEYIDRYNERRGALAKYTPNTYDWVSGYLKRVKQGNVRETYNGYSALLNPNPKYFEQKEAYGIVTELIPYPLSFEQVTEFVPVHSNIPEYKYQSGYKMLTTKVTRSYENGKEIKVEENYLYNTNSLKPTKTEITYGNNEKKTIAYLYSNTTQSTPELSHLVAQKLKDDNREELIKTVIKKNGNIVSTQMNIYDIWTNNIANLKNLKTAKGKITTENPLEDRIQYHRYDNNGNPIELSKANGTNIVYIWGYQNQYPIAKIENATYAQVVGYAEDLQIKSNQDNDHCKSSTCKEEVLRNALQELRDGLPNAMVSTYTYDPLIGVTSMTEPNGYTTYYKYDGFNRLDHIADADGKVLKKYNYNYKDERTIVEVYPPLQLEVKSNHTHIIKGTEVKFSINRSGGSGHYTYLWKVNGAKVSTDVMFNKTFSTVGTYTVSCTLTDSYNEQAVIIKTKTITVYDRLYSSSLSYIKSPYHNGEEGHFSSSKKITFEGGIPKGGSGSLSYKWLVNGVDQGNNTTTFTKAFSPGTHKITFRTIDAKIPGESIDRTMTIKSYGRVTIDNLTYDHTGFKTLARGGSGSYRYDWYVNTTSGSPYQSSSSSYFIYNYTATASSYQTIFCRVVDLKSGNVSGFKSMQVYFHGQGNNGGGQGNNDGGQGDGNGRDEAPTGGDI